MTVAQVLAGEARWHVEQGDCLDVLRALPDASVDAVVTDPPYGLGTREPTTDEIVAYLRGEDALDTGGDFMGRRWQIPSVAIWREVARVCKPGAHVLAFGGTRTFDLISLGLRAAGFENRDTISCEGVLRWVHGQGFPKSANQGEGRGTAIKPAWEPVLVFRKPLAGTVAANVAEYGTGAINVDACRIAGAPRVPGTVNRGEAPTGSGASLVGSSRSRQMEYATNPPAGRWPANVVLSHLPECREVGVRRVRSFAGCTRGDRAEYGVDLAPRTPGERIVGYASPDGTETVPAFDCAPGCAVAALDEQSGHSAPKAARHGRRGGRGFGMFDDAKSANATGTWPADAGGGASRFFATFQADEPRLFYTAKASQRERNAGLGSARSTHPCVKPLALMRWLARLVTPPGGVVLDPFTGSGSTGCACALEGFRFVGIEREPEYVEIARARIAHWEAQAAAPAKPKRAPKLRAVPTPPPSAPRPADERQLDLLARMA